MKLALAFIFLGLISISYGLRCQVCSGENYECNGGSADNGEEKECAAEEDACFYSRTYASGETVTRSCMVSSNVTEECIDLDFGDIAGLTFCWCNEDLCNKDKTCACNSATAFGASTLSLFIAAFILKQFA
eukprot:01186.XXX_2367_2939_1 [CDS] Oithona nana genome sequencing.